MNETELRNYFFGRMDGLLNDAMRDLLKAAQDEIAGALAGKDFPDLWDRSMKRPAWREEMRDRMADWKQKVLECLQYAPLFTHPMADCPDTIDSTQVREWLDAADQESEACAYVGLLMKLLDDIWRDPEIKDNAPEGKDFLMRIARASQWVRMAFHIAEIMEVVCDYAPAAGRGTDGQSAVAEEMLRQRKKSITKTDVMERDSLF